ncbi:MAG: hypothetical protein FWD97_00755 [Defluviitaleaceae bacterium]|nr:hypothetical protein [Defluviitaleaceae bacterium]
MMENNNNEQVKIEQLLADLPDHDLPQGLHTKIMQSVRAQRRKKSALRLVKPVGAAAAAVFVFVFWFNLWNQSPTPPYESVAPATFADGEILPMPMPTPRDVGQMWYDSHTSFVTTTLWLDDLAPAIAEVESLPEGIATIAEADVGTYITIQITEENFSLVQQTLRNIDIYLAIEPNTEIVILLIEMQ